MNDFNFLKKKPESEDSLKYSGSETLKIKLKLNYVSIVKQAAYINKEEK